MKTKLFAALSALALATPVGATPANFDNALTEQLGQKCELGSVQSCRRLVELTGGNCAGPVNSGCRFGLEIVEPNEQMVIVPGLEHQGPSRISTVRHCAELNGVDNWRALITDSEFEGMDACLTEHT